MNYPWIILSLLTVVRLVLAALGHVNETESYLMLCAHHLDWGFVEGPAGVPAVMRVNGLFFGNTPLAVRWLSPIFLLGASWILWRFTLSFRNKNLFLLSTTTAMRSMASSVLPPSSATNQTAFWTVIAFNCLPLTNAAGVIMDGTMLVTLCWLAAIYQGWELITKQMNKISSWIAFGVILALGTQVTYQIGWLLPLVLIASLESVSKVAGVTLSWSRKRALGMLVATLLLVLSWLPLLWWNSCHDWLQWQETTWNAFWSWPPYSNDYFQHLPVVWALLLLVPLLVSGACCFSGLWMLESPFCLLLSVPLFFGWNELGHAKVPFALLLVLTALFLPKTIDFFFQTERWRRVGIVLLISIGCCSLFLFLGKILSSTTQESPWNFPSLRGVVGAEIVARELLGLRSAHTDIFGRAPFLIAETPGLAAILGAVLPISYPEMSEAPSIFIPESPALGSQFLLWPHYADATVAATAPDPLYTEEREVSPFLGRDALYITREKLEEIPQTVSGAFATIIPLSQVLSLEQNGQSEEIKIYLCQCYQMLSM